MAELPLKNGMTAFLDDDDLGLIDGRRWYAHKSSGKFYVASKATFGGKAKVTFLHRLILDDERSRVRFINGNPLDCRRSNLKVGGYSSPAVSYERGSLGEALVIADLTRHRHDVFVPISGHTAADLISVDSTGAARRWQVKYRSRTLGTSSLVVSLSATQPRRDGNRKKPYNLDLIDGFAVVAADNEAVYYIPVSDLDTSRGVFSVCLGPNAEYDHARNGLEYLSPNISVTPKDTLAC